MPTFAHFTLQKAAAISKAVVGSFTGPKQTEIVAAHGKCLALYRILDNGKIQQLYNEEVFGLIRNLAAFRLTGGTKDHLAVTSDSGRIAIVDWDAERHAFVKLHQETYGKTGSRRVVAGEFLSVDPKGRTLVLGAVERQKFVYILNRDVAGRMQIGSPLEAHKSHQICFDMCSLDVGYENPVFVSLETSYESIEQPLKGTYKPPPQQLAFWEMDLGLNHVVKKCTLSCDQTASLLIPVPAGTEFSEGPGGVLVCCQNFVQFRKPDHPDVVCAIPRRLEMDPDRGLMITAWTSHRMKDFFFVLLQTEYGDLYRLEILNEGPTVTKLVCRYLDSISVAASLCVLKTGFLFVASETGDHAVYQFIGIDEDEISCASDHPDGKNAVVPFKPRRLRNLLPVSTWASMAPLTDFRVIDCVGDAQTPQLYSLCGSGPRSHLSILRQGLSLEEIAASELPGFPTGLWTLSEKTDDKYHSYILLSFNTLTLVLRVTDSIEEQTTTQFITDRPTLHAACLVEDSHLQVTEDGWRLLQPTKETRRITEWKVPLGKRVVAAASNESQVLLALTGGYLVYFEFQLMGNRTLVETGTHDLGHDVTSLSIQPTSPDAISSSFAAIGGIDRSVKTISLDKDRVLFRQISLHMLSADTHAESLALCRLPFSATEREELFGTTLFVGLSTGILLRLQVDSNTGQIQPHRRQKFLGANPVRVVPVQVTVPAMDESSEQTLIGGCMALSSKCWLAHAHRGQFRLNSLICEQINLIASLNSVHCSYGFVAISGNVLRITSVPIDNQDKLFSETRIPLEYTPRKITVFPPPPTTAERQEAQLKRMPIMLLPPSAQRPWYLATIESDHNAFDMATKEEISKALAEVKLSETEENPEESTPPETQVGTYKAGEGKWGGCLRLLNPSPASIVHTIPYGADEAPTCIAVCQFLEYPEHPALVVGTVTGLNLKSKKCLKGAIKVYVYNAEGLLSLHHETPLEDVPLALCAWSGRLLASVGNRIRIYTLGRKRLLKRCEYKNLPVGVNWLKVSGNRIFACDIREGFHVLKYNAAENHFSVCADMTVPRWVTSGELLDSYTIIGADKFDNLFVVRMPPAAISDRAEVDTSALKMRGDTAYVTGQTHKLERICEFHLGDLATAVQKCLLAPGGSEVIIFGTILGGIGVLMPLQTSKEVELLQHLEMLLRNEEVSLVGRDHTFFRSAYFPVKNAIDGDLLRMFSKLKAERQIWVAQQIDKSPSDILRLLDELQARII